VSIPSNIAEGPARNSTKEFIQSLYIALGSLAELATQLLLARELEFVPEKPPCVTITLYPPPAWMEALSR